MANDRCCIIYKIQEPCTTFNQTPLSCYMIVSHSFDDCQIWLDWQLSCTSFTTSTWRLWCWYEPFLKCTLYSLCFRAKGYGKGCYGGGYGVVCRREGTKRGAQGLILGLQSPHTLWPMPPTGLRTSQWEWTPLTGDKGTCYGVVWYGMVWYW